MKQSGCVSSQVGPLYLNQASVSPVCGQALPEGDGAVSAPGHHPGVCQALGLSANTHVGIQAEPQQQTAQQGGMVLTVALETHNQSDQRDVTVSLETPKTSCLSLVSVPNSNPQGGAASLRS